MYGTVARYHLKPGMESKLQEFQSEMQEVKMPGFVAEFTYLMDEDPSIYYEAIIFESREAYHAFAALSEQDARYQKLVKLLVGEPEWHDGEIVNAVPHIKS